MDWPIEDTPWTYHDLKIFGFEERFTVALRKLQSDEALIRKVLLDKNDWENWFHDVWRLSVEPHSGANQEMQIPSATSKKAGLHIVLCSRASPIFEGHVPISYISMPRDTWGRLTGSFHVHRCITRTITREVSCFASSYENEDDWTKSKISFTARMSSSLPGDLALSLTYIPSTDSTFAVMFGCDNSHLREIENRVRAATESINYPLLMIGIFAELERGRLVAMADQLFDGFALTSEHLEGKSWDPTRDMNDKKAQENLSLCLRSRTIADNIRAVKRQVLKLMTEIDEFGDFVSRQDDERARRFKKAGSQMKKRLRDIMNEYDGKIDECDMMVGNTTLAMQTVWNQFARYDSGINTQIARANTNIALETKRDGVQMRSIALLTMVYLPFSSVASIFSMNMFDWSAQDGGSVVSKYIWVFAVFAVGLSAITLFAWYYITYRHKKTPKKDTSEISV
ncbi:uncharacterized protein F4822DRAFT_423632 [Hypoxylon trugodes]|uniref:uncharacterized protein n=1 Tax=Hypoxylon trugodes TaxID=326681 RepID=UPI0021927FBC|nr:uncharacterized protein F4822DRAFT_423632 [Hypoxylon trugodes]KAI1393169.1 hypothetical protein F4822DRAFT_423632 [Hypoxylon trugodes]